MVELQELERAARASVIDAVRVGRRDALEAAGAGAVAEYFDARARSVSPDGDYWSRRDGRLWGLIEEWRPGTPVSDHETIRAAATRQLEDTGRWERINPPRGDRWHLLPRPASLARP